MWVALVVGLLFLAGAAYNLFGPDHNQSEALAGAAIGALLIGVFFFIKSERRRDDTFLEWLVSNAAVIEKGGARYGHLTITSATVLTRYDAALSFLLVSFKIPSRFYVVDQDATGIAAAIFSSVSLLLGWWGLPWGPVYTVQALWTNLKGGVKQTVSELLHPVPI